MTITDEFEQADAVRCEIYGLLRLMRGCSLDRARGASRDTWMLRYLAATQATRLALTTMNADQQEAA